MSESGVPTTEVVGQLCLPGFEVPDDTNARQSLWGPSESATGSHLSAVPVVGQLCLPGLEAPADTAAPRSRWGPPPAVTVARFWSRVTRTPTCWWWTGAVSHPDGYGRLSVTADGVTRTLSAHRFALLLEHGDLDEEGMVAEHHCNETLCVRVHPAHLHRGTQTANMRYAVALGRHRGPRPGNVDPRGRYARAVAIRAALVGGYDPVRLATARDPHPDPALFDLPTATHPAAVGQGWG